MVITLIRTALLYTFVTIGIRLMGKRQIGDMQPNELVVTLLISEIAAIPLQDTTQPVINGIVAICALVVIEILLSALSVKSHVIRRVLSGKSVIIIKDGEIDQNAMKKVRLTVIDLIELLRAQDVFDISTVAYAVLEVNGSLSVLLKNAEQPPTKQEMAVKKKPDSLQMPVIIDGTIMKDSLADINATEAAIYAMLKEQSLTVDDVFLMTLDSLGNSRIVKQEEAA